MNYGIKLPTDVSYLIDRLDSLGYRAHIVGGCVRDVCLGKAPNDYDITTSASPEEIKNAFSHMKTIDTGIRHGTVTVIVNHVPYEITTYRLDGEYTDNRHPDSVTFTEKLSDDLSRRDFTVNAMAYNEKEGLCDLFSGREDLQRKLIRAVGDPERRFTEDALRILRALRFASTLDFEIEEKTEVALRKKTELLSAVSMERIFTEWKKLISGVGAYRIINKFHSVIEEFIPELSECRAPEAEEFELLTPELRELLLFVSSENPGEAYKNAMTRLKSDNSRKKKGVAILENLGVNLENKSDVHRLVINIGEDYALDLIKIRSAMGKCPENTIELFYNLVNENAPFKVSELSVNGNDLLRIGIKGKACGELLTRLLFLVADGKIRNSREELIDFIRNEVN